MQMRARNRKCANCGGSYSASEGRCPDCGTHTGRQGEQQAQVRYALGYPQCDWESGGLRCRYPGSISTGTTGEGSRFCKFHFACESAAYGEQIVQASQDYAHMSAIEKIEEANTAAREFCGGNVVRKVPTVRPAKPDQDWARKIMSSIDAGEQMPSPLLERFARDALGLESK